jgi:uncharacterized protein YgbK (DUF1537 family)
VAIALGNSGDRAAVHALARALREGAPLVRAHAADPAIDGLELVLKGGQMGSDGFFEAVRQGRSVPAAGAP